MDKKRYPGNWNEITEKIKQKADWKCEACGHKHDKATAHVLTTAHIIPIPELCENWNLIALCQRCHLKFERKELTFKKTLIQWYENNREDWLEEILRDFADRFRRKITLEQRIKKQTEKTKENQTAGT